jgi:hypothetical protein
VKRNQDLTPSEKEQTAITSLVSKIQAVHLFNSPPKCFKSSTLKFSRFFISSACQFSRHFLSAQLLNSRYFLSVQLFNSPTIFISSAVQFSRHQFNFSIILKIFMSFFNSPTIFISSAFILPPCLYPDFGIQHGCSVMDPDLLSCIRIQIRMRIRVQAQGN